MKRHSIFIAVCIGIALLAGCLSAAANIPPTSIDAKEAIRIQEQQYQLRQQQEQASRPEQSQAQQPLQPLGKMPKNESPCAPIKHLQLTGEFTHQFHWLLAAANVTETFEPDPAIPGCLGANGLNLVMQRLQRALEKRGFVTTKVLFYPQEFKDETLTLRLLPGRINKIRVVSSTPPYVRTRNAVPFKEGDIINIRAIDQAVENFNRPLSAKATVTLAASESPDAPEGSSDVLIDWKQTTLPYHFTFSLDNSGSRSTGIYQANATLAIDHLLHANDLFYVSATHDLGGGDPDPRGSRGVTVHYSIPWHYWLLGFTASSNTYDQTIANLIAPYSYNGESDNYELKLSHLMYRNAQRETRASVALWHKKSRNYIEDVEIDIQRRRTAGFDFGLSHREYIKSATLDVQLTYRQGTGIFHSLPAPEEAIGDGSSQPQILSVSTYLNLPFTLGQQRFRYTNQMRAQWNGTPLIPQDRFAIGGRYTVRGFDGDEQLLSDRGWLTRNDLGLVVGESGQELYVGLDGGFVSGRSADTLVGKQLAGAVLGLRGGRKIFSYDISFSTPLYKPPGFTTSPLVMAFSLNWNF